MRRLRKVKSLKTTQQKRKDHTAEVRICACAYAPVCQIQWMFQKELLIDIGGDTIRAQFLRSTEWSSETILMCCLKSPMSWQLTRNQQLKDLWETIGMNQLMPTLCVIYFRGILNCPFTGSSYKEKLNSLFFLYQSYWLQVSMKKHQTADLLPKVTSAARKGVMCYHMNGYCYSNIGGP